MDEVNADLTIQDMKEVAFWMKNNKETGCDNIPPEAGCWL